MPCEMHKVSTRWQILESKYIGDNYKMLVTDLIIYGINIHYLFT